MANYLDYEETYVSKILNSLMRNPKPEKSSPEGIEVKLNFVKATSRLPEEKEYQSQSVQKIRYYRVNVDTIADTLARLTEEVFFELEDSEKRVLEEFLEDEQMQLVIPDFLDNLYEEENGRYLLSILNNWLSSIVIFRQLRPEHIVPGDLEMTEVWIRYNTLIDLERRQKYDDLLDRYQLYYEEEFFD